MPGQLTAFVAATQPAGAGGLELQNRILELITGKTAFSTPTTYLALSTADPGDDGSTLSEPSGNNYSRLATSGSDWAAASGGVISNANALTLPEASGSWGTLTHYALMDASSGGNVLSHGSLGTSLSPVAHETVEFEAGDLEITLT